MPETISIHVSDSVGNISAELIQAEHPKYVMTLAHGAGAGMHHPFLKKLSISLTGLGISTIRFNFPYMEKGKKMPDRPPIATQTIEAVLAKAHELFPDKIIIAAGKSFGGRMSSHLLCKPNIPYVKALIFYGFPLHPPEKPGTERAEHLPGISVPMLFLQGTKDTLARLDLIQQVCSSLRLSTLKVIEGADHSFKVGNKDSIDILSRNTIDWLETLSFA